MVLLYDRFSRRTGFNPLIIRHQQVEPWLAAANPDGPLRSIESIFSLYDGAIRVPPRQASGLQVADTKKYHLWKCF